MFKKFYVILVLMLMGNAYAKCLENNEITILPFEYTIKNDISLEDLKQKLLDKKNYLDRTKAGKNASPVGYVETEQKVSLKVLRNEEGCIYFKIKAGFPPAIVYIPKEFKENDCPYNTVLAHEMEHVKIYQDFILILKDKINIRLEKIHEKVQKMNLSDAGDLALDEAYFEADKIVPLQKSLDSYDEYKKTQFACNERILKIINH